VKYLLIMNPGSRSGKGQRLWETWKSGFDLAGIEYKCVYTERIGHAIELARTAVSDVVVAVGGDGTINEVLDGVIQSDNPDLKMGVLYSGTSPDFCRFHGIPIDPAEAVKALLSDRFRRVDVAEISYFVASGQEVTAHFGCSCNIGMGASIARFANRWRRYLDDTLGTGLGVITTIVRNCRVDVDMEIDGVKKHLTAVNNLTIAKNPYIASGLKLQIGLQADDENLKIVGMHGRSRLGIFRLLPKYYSGSVTAVEGIYVQECQQVTISSEKTQEIEFDGDPHGYLPVRIRILPKALTLIGGHYD
jgi:diacylglycerol kinase family enzyme